MVCIIDLMSCESLQRASGLEASLDFQKDFSYINLIQEELSKDQRPSRLKIHSKISAPLVPRNHNSRNKNLEPKPVSRSEIRKKSKTVEKSPAKKKNSSRKSRQKNHQSNNKRFSKTIELKPRQLKLRSTKSLKIPHSKKTYGEDISKRHDLVKKKKLKDGLSPKEPKRNKSRSNKSVSKTKVNKTKSQSQFDRIALSEIKKQPKIGAKQSKIIHEYFGMEDKLSSIVEEKDKRHKRNQSKLSKCKTQSSTSSISLKKVLKFNSKKTVKHKK